MIPKVIHYCWFGGNPKPELIERCIASWKKYCPDWEIKEWNESNFDIQSIPYMAEAYDAKKWAFVSDVARLKILYDQGGIYLDTDVELLDSIDHLLENGAFFAFESERIIASGLGFGAEKQHNALKTMLNYYENKHFVINGKPDLTPCPSSNTEVLIALYPTIRQDGKTQRIDDLLVLSYGKYNEFAKHHYAASWTEGPKAKQKPYKDTWLKRVLRKPERFDYISQHFSKKVLSIYTFFSYDFLEFGPNYYIRKILFRLVKKK